MTTLTKKAVGPHAAAVDVSLQEGLPITIGAGPGTDSYMRLRTSQADTIFESKHQYDKGDLLWVERTVGASSSSYIAEAATVRLTVGGDTDDSIVRQSRQYMPYQLGKTLQVLLTFATGTLPPELRFRTGYFDDDNGVYVEQFDDEIAIVLRSKASGSVVETLRDQGNWNIDKFDGQGRSGIRLDKTKTQVVAIDYQWHAAGIIRVFFIIDGMLMEAHEFRNSNAIFGPFMTTPNLPVRYELTNVGGGASDSIDIISTSVSMEGGYESTGPTFGADTGDTLVSLASRRALISIRPKLMFKSLVNRGMIIPVEFSVLADQKEARFELIYDGTLGGVPAWNSADDESIVEYDVSGTTVTGGIKLKSVYIERERDIAVAPGMLNNTPLALDVDGGDQKMLSLVGTTTVGGIANAAVGAQWEEPK